MPGAVVDIAALMHVLPAIGDLLCIRGTVNFQISDVVIVTERIEADAAQRSEEARSLDAIQVNSPASMMSSVTSFVKWTKPNPSSSTS